VLLPALFFRYHFAHFTIHTLTPLVFPWLISVQFREDGNGLAVIHGDGGDPSPLHLRLDNYDSAGVGSSQTLEYVRSR
jgi:hypothetical protein